MSEQQHPSVPSFKANLPELINRNIESVVALHAQEERNLSHHRRWVGTVTHFVGRPVFLYVIVAVVLSWILSNTAPKKWNLPRFDPPPFNGLSVGLSFSALLVTVGVLIQQDRQEKLAEQRAQLSLQLSMLSEQKITKLIVLMEEMRRDLPGLQHRPDIEVEEMQQVADPHQVLTVLQDTLSQELNDIQKESTGFASNSK
jgi:uncharacterized membrane protein